MPSFTRPDAGPTSRHVRRAGAITVGILAVLFGAMVSGGAVHAQDDAEGPVTEVRGTLRATDENGDDIVLEGVELVVTDAEGTEVGVAVSDSDGAWSLELPGEGTYSTFLKEETLPDGVSLRNVDNNPLTFDVREGDSRPNLFPIGERAAKTDNTIKAVQLAVDGVKLGLIIAMCCDRALADLRHDRPDQLRPRRDGHVRRHDRVPVPRDVASRVVGGWMTSLIVAALMAVIVSGVAGGLFNEFVWKTLRDTRRQPDLGARRVDRLLDLLPLHHAVPLRRSRRLLPRLPDPGEVVDFGVFTLGAEGPLHHRLLDARARRRRRSRCRRRGRARRCARSPTTATSPNRPGIDVEKVIRWVWVVGSALAGLGGVLFGLDRDRSAGRWASGSCC